MTLERLSPCKINLLLNILGRRPDGFHELETVMHPIAVHDRLQFTRGGQGIRLTCNLPDLPTDGTNLVHRAAQRFLDAAGIKDGVGIHLEKKLPLAAGLGGGSANAATTLAGLNELFGGPLSLERLTQLAARLGSDVPFFLQNRPALGLGRGELVRPLARFPALDGCWVLLVYPGFGISTAWAYQSLARFPEALHGRPGRALELVSLLEQPRWPAEGIPLFNSLEAPAFEKFPVLELCQEFFRAEGAMATLMSGSGSTTFALFRKEGEVQRARERYQDRFGARGWLAAVPL